MMLQLALTELNNKTYDETVAIHGSSEDIIGQLISEWFPTIRKSMF